MNETRDKIFISHRTTDAKIADMIKDFLVNTGIPNDKIFCSSLPGNDVDEKISAEVKANLKKSAIIILILSNDYYESAYCLNEAGIAWYLDETTVIPFGLPEIDEKKMIGFVNSDYKLRRLDEEVNIAYLFDKVNERLSNFKSVKHTVITQETKKLKEKYLKHLENREISVLDEDDDIFEDGYHEIKNGDGQVLQKGEFVDGHLIDGIEYNIVIRVAKGEEGDEKPVPFEELKDEKWHYNECGQYEGLFELMIAKDDILEEGLQFFYVVDKKVQMEGKQLKPTFTNFRSLENFLEKEEPDEIEYIRTGVRKYSQTDYADVDV